MPNLRRRLTIPALAALAVAGCDSRPRELAARVPTRRPRPIHVDSILPREEAIRRFRGGLIDPAGLSGGARSREDLVNRFLQALEAADTAGLRALTLTRAEFAYVYYPMTPAGLPPYNLNPDIMWLMLSENSEKGLRAAIEKLGGRPIVLGGSTCGPPKGEGANQVIYPCQFELRLRDMTLEARLFGPIVERRGTYKLLSLANTLD